MFIQNLIECIVLNLFGNRTWLTVSRYLLIFTWILITVYTWLLLTAITECGSLLIVDIHVPCFAGVCLTDIPGIWASMLHFMSITPFAFIVCYGWVRDYTLWWFHPSETPTLFYLVAWIYSIINHLYVGLGCCDLGG